MEESVNPAKLSEELLNQYKSGRDSWAKEAKECEDFALGNQWTKLQEEELKKRKQAPVVINVILPAVEQAVAMLTTNKPRFSSTAREDSDVRTGKAFSELMSYIWDQSEGNEELKLAINDAYVKGMGVMCAYIDPHADFGKGDILIRSIDPFDLYVDPNAKDRFFRDAANILISKTMAKEEIERLYPDFDFEGANEAALDDHPASQRASKIGSYLDTYHKHYRIIDRYTKVKKVFIHIYYPQDNLEKVMDAEQFNEFIQEPAMVVSTGEGQRIVTNPQEVEYWMGMFEQLGPVFFYTQDPQSGQQMPVSGEDDGSGIPGSQHMLQPVTMEQLVEAQIIQINRIYQDRILRVLSIGNKLYYEGIMGNLEHYPMVPIMFRFKRNPYPVSDVMVVRSNQEYINKTKSLIIAHAANATNVKILVNKGSIDKKNFEAEFNKAGTAVLEVDFELGVPQVVAPVALPNELYKNEADGRRDIQEILGIYALMQGDAGQAPATYKGTVALDEYGQRRIKSKKDDIEGSLNMLAKIVVQMIQMVYTEPRVFRILRPNNVEGQVVINQPLYDDVSRSITGKLNDVTVGKYDVVVVSGSMLPSNRWAQLEYYQNLYQMGIIDQVEVLKKTEVADIEGVLERHSQIAQLTSQLQQATEQIQKLQGDIQTLERENYHNKQRVEVQKFQTQLHKAAAEGKASISVTQARMKDSELMQEERLANERKLAQAKMKKGTK